MGGEVGRGEVARAQAPMLGSQGQIPPTPAAFLSVTMTKGQTSKSSHAVMLLSTSN